jgi:hypothetical protein
MALDPMRPDVGLAQPITTAAKIVIIWDVTRFPVEKSVSA